MVRRIELLLGVGTALAAIAAMMATIFMPVATTGLIVAGRAPIIQSVYARDYGVVRMIVVMALIALLGALVLLGAFAHARRGSPLGRVLVCAAVPCFFVLAIGSIKQGAFAEYPFMVTLACALFALLPTRWPPASETQVPAHSR